jgi:SusD family.
MKKNIIFTLAVIGILSLFSCNNVLNVDPVDSFTDVAVWGDLSLAEAYLNASYSKMKAENQKGSRFASLTDEVYQMHTYGTENVTQGLLSCDNSSFGWEDDMWNPWSYFYGCIKSVNLFMEKIDGVPAKSSDDAQWKKELKGQGYFLRAYFYHNLYSLFGRVPIITHTYNIDSQNFNEKRASMDEVADFIVAQCDSAAKLLPVEYADASDFGRATKGAALGIKARTLLYAASPLYGTPSADKWQKAADANKAVIDLKKDDGSPAYYLKSISNADEYAALFYDKKNPEVILEKLFDTKWVVGTNASYLHQAPAGQGNGFQGWGTLQPTQEIVDKFQKNDGSKYVQGPETEYPWADRDLRLYATIFLDGSKWGYGSDNRTIEFFTAAETGAPDGQDSRMGPFWWNATQTGYGMKKFLNPGFDSYGTIADTSPWFFLRLSEFYLNYAECQIELNNPSEALTYINKVRTRALMPAATGANLRAEYEYERQVELLFEGQHWFDIRRWKTAENVYKQPVTGISILCYSDGHKKYVRITDPIETRHFNAPQNYWMPVPRSELRKAPNIDAAPYE